MIQEMNYIQRYDQTRKQRIDNQLMNQTIIVKLYIGHK